MFRKIVTPLAGLLGLAVLSSGALASDAYGSDQDGIKIWKPYVIEKTCANGLYDCKVRMDYAPYQRAMTARPGSYWYQTPFMVYRYGDFRPQGAQHAGAAAHEAWCSAHYRSYDPATDTFLGKGNKRYRCVSP